MSQTLKTLLIATLLAGVTLISLPVEAQQRGARAGRGGRGGARSHDDVVEAAGEFLKKGQSEDGTWSKEAHPGITGMVLTGLFRSGQLKADDPQAVKALAFVQSLADPEAGHLAAVPNTNHVNYLTSVNVLALIASGDDKYQPLIDNGVKYLKGAQLDEGESKAETDLDYGGFGYRAGTRPDLSNTHFAIDALRYGGVPKDDPVFAKTVVFVSRAQNLSSPHNPVKWANVFNDGSFIYTIGSGPIAADADATLQERPGYGSMTFAGLKCLIVAGVPENDPRRVKAREWIAANWSVDQHPGREIGAGGQGYFYYLSAMAKCLDALGEDVIVDAKGKPHDWKAEITRALSLRQRPDGSWGNDFRNWMESNADLDTAYALITLSYTKPATP